MVDLWRHNLTVLGKILLTIGVGSALLVVILVAYNLMGPMG